MSKLASKTCVVTGGGKGIGRGIALAFAAEGASVAVLDRDEVARDKTVAEITSSGGTATGVHVDVADQASVSAAFTEVRRVFGPVDVLVNNAGIISYGTVADMPIELWDTMIAINLRSVFLCSREVVADMRERKWGRIINLSSQLAHRGALELAHYSAAKAGILGFTRAFAREVIGDGINVNAICPGPIDTELSRTNSAEWRARLVAGMPIHRYGEVEEIAPTAVLLASDAGSFYVGASFNPNGGDVMI
jgi:3-oxoacyl-[acyl-carrier protein] reductase